MKNIAIFYAILFSFFSILASPSLAQTKTKAATIITLPTFVIGETNIVDKPILGDLMVAGGESNITSTITGDTYVAGGQINISGNITGNLIVVGGNIAISGNIGRNLIIAGGQVTLDSTSTINGYVLVAGGRVNFQGKVLGPIKIGAGDLTIGDKVVIGGNLVADVSQSEISSTSKINGTKTVNIHKTKSPKINSNQWRGVGVAGDIYGFLSKLVVLLVLVKLLSRNSQFKNLQISSFWSTLGWGLVVLIVTPFILLFLLLTIIGAPLSFLLLATYIITVYMSSIVTSIAIGKMVIDKKLLTSTNAYLQGFVGLLLLTLAGMIPLVGGFVKMIVLFLGVGIIFKQVSRN